MVYPRQVSRRQGLLISRGLYALSVLNLGILNYHFHHDRIAAEVTQLVSINLQFFAETLQIASRNNNQTCLDLAF